MATMTKNPFLVLTILLLGFILANASHHITFKYPKLYPGGFDWDPQNQRFIVGSLRLGTLHTVSESGTIEDFIKDREVETVASIKGVKVDAQRSRVLSVIQYHGSLALASYDLNSFRRTFFVNLEKRNDNFERNSVTNVEVDPYGNAYVTSNTKNLIWRVDMKGNLTLFCRISYFSRAPGPPRLIELMDSSIPDLGVNGIAYSRNGSFLVTQSSTGLLHRVGAEDGVSRVVILPKRLFAVNGIAVRNDGIAVAVSPFKAWFLQSLDGWNEASVVGEVRLDFSMFVNGVGVRDDGRSYVLGSYFSDRMNGVDREEFAIHEIELPKDGVNKEFVDCSRCWWGDRVGCLGIPQEVFC